MPFTATIRNTLSVAGKNFPQTVTITSDSIGGFDRSGTNAVPAAKSGTLAVRTSNTVGTLTMAGGHGITTGARLDLYWAGGRRRGILVGTVSTNSVPFTAGAGDNLPAATTAITAQVPLTEDLAVTGDNAVLLTVYCPANAQVVFAADDDTEIAVASIIDGVSYVWYTALTTNPLAAATVAKAFISHSNAAAVGSVSSILMYN